MILKVSWYLKLSFGLNFHITNDNLSVANFTLPNPYLIVILILTLTEIL